MRLGAHLGTRGGLRSAADEARTVGAEVVQLFLSNPRSWAGPRIETAERFGTAWREGGVGPFYAHSPYLVNIASPNPEFLLNSVELARATVEACEQVGAGGVVLHAGSGGTTEAREALARAAASLQAVLAAARETSVVVELTAGTTGSVAATFPEAARLFEAVGDERLLLCADTCHLFAAGYPINDGEGVDACFADLHASGLADRLVLIHANDAKFHRGSKRDRHEHIGEGFIGVEGFIPFLHRPEVADLAIVAETPGDLADHARNIATIRRLAA